MKTNFIKELKKLEVMSLCLNCKTKWNGKIKKCEKCGATYTTKAYQSRIEYYIDYGDIQDLIKDSEEKEQMLGEIIEGLEEKEE